MARLGAAGSGDADDNKIIYGWTQDTRAGYATTITIDETRLEIASEQKPAAAAGQDIHLVLCGVNDGTPPLAFYYRVILRVGSDSCST